MPGLLRHFSRHPASARPRQQSVQAVLYDGDEPLDVVGESHYQEELWAIVGGRRLAPVRHDTYAILLPEPDNPVDENAISVWVELKLVGYLSREDAALYRDGLLRLIAENEPRPIALHAQIVGGGEHEDRLGYLGVFLDHDPTDFGLQPHPVQHIPVRTGWLLAATTDAEDDSYDLSWRAKLSPRDSKAIPQLRSLLETERAPISRHYVYCELEHCLYHSRNAFPSALDDFDAACEQHAQEMDAIRPALVAKFEGVPVIEMYQQATNRCAKAKRWQDARKWAECGIAVYGDEATRPEVVDDLRKRLEHAIAKLEEAAHPKPRPRRAAPTVIVPTELETLVCTACGGSFKRARSRGRKPEFCPGCRESNSPTATNRGRSDLPSRPGLTAARRARHCREVAERRPLDVPACSAGA